jgi:hypothetical protein
MKLATYLHLEQRLRMSRAILPLYPLDGVDRNNYHLYLLLALPSGIIFFGKQGSENSFRLAFTALATPCGVPIIHTDTYVRV